MYTMQRK
jgi:hypothetical protein